MPCCIATHAAIAAPCPIASTPRSSPFLRPLNVRCNEEVHLGHVFGLTDGGKDARKVCLQLPRKVGLFDDRGNGGFKIRAKTFALVQFQPRAEFAVRSSYGCEDPSYDIHFDEIDRIGKAT